MNQSVPIYNCKS